MRRLLRCLPLLPALLAAQAPTTAAAPSRIARVIVSPAQREVAAGDTLRLTAEARDAAGALRWTGAIVNHTEERDVRMARPAIDVPCAELPDGAYEVTVRTLLGDQPPRPTDPIVRWTFHVLRGYQQRAETELRYDAARAGGDGQLACVFHAMGEPEFRDGWMRCWCVGQQRRTPCGGNARGRC